MTDSVPAALSYAGFWIRMLADVVDSILLDIVTCLILLMGLGAVYWIKRGFLLPPGETMPDFIETFDPFVIQIILGVIRTSLAFAYFSFATYRYGTTLGKKLFRIYVVSYPQENELSDPDEPLQEVAITPGKHHKTLRDSAFVPVTLKNSIIRSASYLLSYLPFGTGFFMILFHPEKRALHDLLAGTVSIIKSEPVRVSQ